MRISSGRFHVPRWFNDWRMPSPSQSLQFAFDLYPLRSYETVGALPFAVHGRANIEAIRTVLGGSAGHPQHLDEFERGDVDVWTHIWAHTG